MKTKFIVFDGIDNCGKSSLITELGQKYFSFAQVVNFKKTLPSGALLRINTEKDFELLFSMFDLLDKSTTFMLDRFVVSNLVYDSVLRGEDTKVSRYYYEEFTRRFQVLEIFLTRPKVTVDFEDDRIKLTRDQFNGCIDEYKKYGDNYQILNRDENDVPTTARRERQLVLEQCGRFIIG